MSLSLKCSECGKADTEVLRLVCLSKKLLLCSECIDIAHELAHEIEGSVKIGVSELETLRRNSFIGANAATWVQLVRRAVEQADKSLEELSQPAVQEAPCPHLADCLREGCNQNRDGAPCDRVVAVQEAHPVEGHCPRCGGSGEFNVPSNGGPDPEMIPSNCDHCGGTGALSDAYRGVAKLLEREQTKHMQTRGLLIFDPDTSELHPNTRNLVARFAQALAVKLLAAEKKYGYSDGWMRRDWMDECRTHLMEHVAKGDPRDVAAYCAFLWHHGESTTPSHPVAAAGEVALQPRVLPWLHACFGAEIAGDKIERNHRFIEEALELVQACGCTQDEAHQLVDYVYGRPVGDPHQEAGGVMLTLAALCLAQGLDMHAAGEDELARVWGKVEQIRAKQAAKPRGSALPIATPTGKAPALPLSEEQKRPGKWLPDTTQGERSWPEDFGHENGNYSNECCNCWRMFVGHKRRVLCKVCAEGDKS